MSRPQGPLDVAARDVRAISTELVITLGGIATSIATAGLNLLAQRYAGLDFFSFSFWLVIPWGAFLGGCAAASGYYATARLTQTMPSRTLLFNMVAISASTWLLAKWAAFVVLRPDVYNLWEYLRESAETTKLTISFRHTRLFTTGELGTLGYVSEGLQLLGFMAGGVGSYVLLRGTEVCVPCKRYAKTETLLDASQARFDRVLAEADIALPNLAEQSRAVRRGRPAKGMTLTLSRCPRCHQQWLRPAVTVRNYDDDGLTTTDLDSYPVDAETVTSLRAQIRGNGSTKQTTAVASAGGVTGSDARPRRWH
jgi:hypothetical protein